MKFDIEDYETVGRVFVYCVWSWNQIDYL